MSNIQTKTDIQQALQEANQHVTDVSKNVLATDFLKGTSDNWSSADYLKHLILSVKPFARGLSLPPEQREKIFKRADRASLTYDELVTRYQQGIQAGVRAENSPSFTPAQYKMPDEAEDIQSHLISTWEDACMRLMTALDQWSEDDLDTFVVPHPALVEITIREMCYFTIHHNRLHGNDIQHAASFVS